MEQILSWVVTVTGITGFFLAGKQVWWCWYLNLFCQVLWYWYAWVSNTPAFFVSASFYTIVFAINAWRWTKNHLVTKQMLEEEAERTNRIELPKYN